jgi:hypothetical protein
MNEIKVYLGDGCYARQGRFAGEIILTTEDGISVQNEIFMEPEVLKALNEFSENLKQIKDK